MKRLLLILSLAVFMTGTVFAGTIHVTYPNGKENLCSSKPCTITWTSSGITTPLRVVLVKGGTRVGDIATGLSAGTISCSWTVGNYIGGTAPAGNDYTIRVRNDTAGVPTDSDFSDAPFSILSGPFALTAPNGGEEWFLGSTQTISWTPGCAAGNVRLDLYKGGTNPTNKIGVITTNIHAAPGKYTWKAGDYIGGSAQEGEGYYIVVTSYTPDMKDASNGPFKLVKGKLQVNPAAMIKKCFELTYPRRGDRLHKGSGYNITWTGPSCNDPDYNKNVKMKLDLLTSQTQNLVMTIGQDLPNTGKLLWAVPMQLPDTGFYKMHIQTMDGKYSDMVGPFLIVKAPPPAGPPAIKVTQPGGPGTPAIGITCPIRWTSTCGNIDDAFNIDLMNAAGSTRIEMLLDGSAGSYDGENPAGVHNWHWDWPVTVDPGHYRIRVTSLSGNCVGLGEPFELVNPVRTLDYTLKPGIKGWTCVHNANFLNPMPTRPHCNLNTEQAVVGFDYFQYQDSSGYNEWHGFLTRSQLVFNFNKFKGRKVRVQEAILHLEQKSNYNFNNNYASCAGKVYIMNGSWQDCWNVQTTFWKDLPHDQTAMDVDVTGIASDWFKGTLANNGILLTSSDESFLMVATTCKSCYTAELRLKIQEEYSPGQPPP